MGTTTERFVMRTMYHPAVNLPKPVHPTSGKYTRIIHVMNENGTPRTGNSKNKTLGLPNPLVCWFPSSSILMTSFICRPGYMISLCSTSSWCWLVGSFLSMRCPPSLALHATIYNLDLPSYRRDLFRRVCSVFGSVSVRTCFLDRIVRLPAWTSTNKPIARNEEGPCYHGNKIAHNTRPTT